MTVAIACNDYMNEAIPDEDGSDLPASDPVLLTPSQTLRYRSSNPSPLAKKSYAPSHMQAGTCVSLR